MPFQIDASGFGSLARVGELRNENAVGSGAGGFAGPEFLIAGTEGDAEVGGGAGGNLGDRGTGGIEEHNASPVEDREEALSGVESHIDGTPADHRLVARRTDDLVGGKEV